MNLQTLYKSAGVLAVLAGITYFVQSSDTRALDDPRIGSPALTREALEGVKRIQLTSEEQTLTLVGNESEGKWLLEERYQLPVDMKKLGRFLKNLQDARIERMVTAKQERIVELGFDGGKIAFAAADGAEKSSISFGRETESGKQIVRYGNESKAFLVNDQFSIDGDLDSWLDKSLVTFERDAMRELSLTWPDGSRLRAQRESQDAAWTTEDPLPEGKILDQGALTRAGNRFTNLSFTKTAPKDSEDAADAKERAIAIGIKLADGSQYDFALGRRPEVKVTKEIETEDENGEKKIEQKEEVETPAGPVFLFASSAKTNDPINRYMEAASFEIADYHFTSLPQNVDALLKDAPPTPALPAEPESPAASSEQPASAQ